MSVHELYESLKIDDVYFKATGGGICFGGGEPLLYTRFIKEFARVVDNQWNITVETSLNVPTSQLVKLIDIVNLFIVDVKDLEPAIYQAYTQHENKQVLQNIKYIRDHCKQNKFVIRLPLITGFNNEESRHRSHKMLVEYGFSKFEFFEYTIETFECNPIQDVRL